MNKRIKKHLPCGLYDFKGLERWLDLTQTSFLL